MSDLAIRVEKPCPERSRSISKLCHIGKAQKRHDTLRDVIGDWRLEIEPTKGRAMIDGRVGSLLEDEKTMRWLTSGLGEDILPRAIMFV